MLFEFSFENNSLIGFFGKGGKRYWDAYSVAKFLRYKSVYHFIHRHGKVNAKDVAIPNLLEVCTIRCLQMKLIPEACFLMLMKKSKHSAIQKFYEEYAGEKIIVTTKFIRSYPYIKKCSKGTPGGINFFVWCRDFSIKLVKEPSTEEKSLAKEPQTYSPRSPSCSPAPEELQTYSPRSPSCSPPPEKTQTYSPRSPSCSPPPEEPQTYSPRSPSCNPPPMQNSPYNSPCSPSYKPCSRNCSPADETMRIPISRASETSRPTVQNEASDRPAVCNHCNAPFNDFPYPPPEPSGFMLWYNAIPPTKMLFFHSNQFYEFERKN